MCALSECVNDKINKLYKYYIKIMRIIKIVLTLLLLIGSVKREVRAHSISAAIAACHTLRDNRVNHVTRDRDIREHIATNRMLADMAQTEADRNAAEVAAWNTYTTAMMGIMTNYYIQEAICLAQGWSATAAACLTMAELNALVQATQALNTYNSSMALALYNYNTSFNQIMTTWQDALEEAENLFNNAMALVDLLHFQCLNEAQIHTH